MKPVSKTAFYCCGVRMLDAQASTPVCGDHLASRFIDDETKGFLQQFQQFPRQNASTVMRHRIIDDLLRDALKSNPSTQIVIVGAGFDTRAFRLNGGRWVELDEPAVIAFKQERLPVADAPNPLSRIAIDFSTDSLAERLSAFADDQTIVILEGVVMYLDEAQLTATARAIRQALPHAPIIADLMSHEFYLSYSKKLQDRFAQFGARFCFFARHPVEVFTAAGYTPAQRYSVAERAVEAGTFNMPRWLLRWFFKTLREGYSIWVLAPSSERLSGGAVFGKTVHERQ